MRKCFEHSCRKQALHRFRRFSEPVDQFVKHFIPVFFICDRRNPLIDIKFLIFIRDIYCGNISILIEIKRRFKIRRLFLSLCLTDRFMQQLTVQIIPNRFHMTALRFPENVSCTADLQILHCDPESATKL